MWHARKVVTGKRKRKETDNFQDCGQLDLWFVSMHVYTHGCVCVYMGVFEEESLLAELSWGYGKKKSHTTQRNKKQPLVLSHQGRNRNIGTTTVWLLFPPNVKTAR